MFFVVSFMDFTAINLGFRGYMTLFCVDVELH